jgi:hypothetical protein
LVASSSTEDGSYRVDRIPLPLVLIGRRELRQILLAKPYMSGVERGVRNATVGILDRIADVLGVKLVELVAEPSSTAKRKR